MTRKFQKDNKTIAVDEGFSIWGALFGCFYPLYKGLMKSAGILFVVNLLVAITLMSVDATVGLIINCAVAGFVAPKLMIKQLEDEKWSEIKE